MSDLLSPGRVFLTLLILAPAMAFGAGESDTSGVDGPDTIGVASGRSFPLSAESSARTDTSHSDSPAAAPPAPLDAVAAWKRWKEIVRAIEPGDLDGPQDILEKEEIIQDRVDDLAAEDERLAGTRSQWRGRLQAALVQLEVLDDLAEIQLGGDLQLQQRLENVREDVRRGSEWLKRIDESRGELATEMKRLRELARGYLNRAEELRRQEEGPR